MKKENFLSTLVKFAFKQFIKTLIKRKKLEVLKLKQQSNETAEVETAEIQTAEVETAEFQKAEGETRKMSFIECLLKSSAISGY